MTGKTIRPHRAYTLTGNGLLRKLVTPLEIATVMDPQTASAQPPRIHQVKALWDTGATTTSISPAVAVVLGLVPIGVAKVGHAEGQAVCPTHIVDLRFPGLTFEGVQVIEMKGLGVDEDVLVGMDVIGTGDFAVTNVGGKTKMSFRHPSCEEIDYVAEANGTPKPATTGHSVGRNDPCPCGRKGPTGNPVKYKKCCGLPPSVAATR